MYTIGGVICHHGVLGQKWGKRNGPPYPLSASAHSASEKKAGYKKSIGDGRNESQYGRKKSTNNTTTSKKNSGKATGVVKDLKDQGIIAEVAAITAVYVAPLAIAAVAVAIEKGKTRADTKKAQKKLDEIRSERKGPVDEKTGFHKKTNMNATPEDDMKAVNPLHNNKTKAVNYNCVLCTCAYEMRRRGYDVNANLTAEPLPGMEMYKRLFPDSKQTTIKTESEKFLDPKSTPDNLRIDKNKVNEYYNQAQVAALGANKDHAKAIMAEMSKQPDSRGAMSLTWGIGGGHMVAYEVKNGEFMIRDAQSAKTYKGKELEDLLACTVIAQYQRFDNQKNFNVEEARRMCS